MRINRFSEARGIFEVEEFSLEPHIYCFGGGGGGGEGSGGDYSDLGDAGDTGVSASVAAGGQGWGPDNGSNDQSSNDSQDRRVQSTGSTTNVNIDRSQPSVVADVNGTQRTVYGTQENLDKAVASGDLTPVGNVQDNYTPGTDAAASVYGNIVGDQSAQAAAGPALSGSAGDFFNNVSFAVAPPPSISGEITSLDEQAIADAQARNALSGVSDITSGDQTGTRDLSTTIDPSSGLDPFGEGFMSPEEVAQLDAEIAAKNAEIDALNARFSALSAPAPQATSTPIDLTPQQGRVVSETVLGAPTAPTGIAAAQPVDTVTPGIGGVAGALDIFDPADALTPGQEVAGFGVPDPTADITITGGQPAFSFSRDVLGVDQSIPQMSLAPESRAAEFDRQARMGEVQGPMSMAPVDATRFSGVDMMRQADDVLSQRAIDEAIFGDTSGLPPGTIRAGAEIVNALESTFGGNQARKIADVANRPGGALVRDPRSGEILGAVGPEENLQSAIMGAQDAVYVGDPRGYEQGVEIGTSVLGPDTNVRAVATQDPFGGGMEGEPGVDYSAQVANVPDGGGDSAPPPVVPPDPVTKVCPVGYVADGNGNCVYQGRDVVGATPYTPMGPVNISYTGLPSLAPRTLTPTAPNLNFLTRSQTAQPGTRYPDLQPIAPGGDFGLPPGVRTQAMGSSGPVNIPTYGDIRDARVFMGRPQGIAGLTKS